MLWTNPGERLLNRLATQFVRELTGGGREHDPLAFAHAAGIEPDPWQADVLCSAALQTILLCSRQSGKSTVSALLAVREAVVHGPALVLLLAPTLRQSQELFRKVRELVPLTGTRPARETALTMEFTSGSRIVCLPGTEATIRGYSNVALLVIDEAARVRDDLYQAVRPMLAVSGGRVVLLSTPFGQRGFFHHEWDAGGPDWHRVKVTANQCLRISPAWLAEERERIGDWWYRQEYLCEFVDTVDQVFPTEDVMRALCDDIEPLFPEAA